MVVCVCVWSEPMLFMILIGIPCAGIADKIIWIDIGHMQCTTFRYSIDILVFGMCVFLCKIENLITTKMVSMHHLRKCSIVNVTFCMKISTISSTKRFNVRPEIWRKLTHSKRKNKIWFGYARFVHYYSLFISFYYFLSVDAKWRNFHFNQMTRYNMQ